VFEAHNKATHALLVGAVGGLGRVLINAQIAAGYALTLCHFNNMLGKRGKNPPEVTR